MINHNLLLYNLFDRTISIDFIGKNWIVNYTEGDLFELSMKLKDSQTKYPIIWLQTGYKVERNKQGEQTSLVGCRFFFITKGSKIDRYEQRFKSTYDEVLYPVLNKFDKLIQNNRGIIASNIDNFTAFPFNDTTELGRKENNGKSDNQKATIADIWDAILLETNLTISNSCFPELIIK